MKKKILGLCFALVLLVPAVILLSACNEKKVQSITVDDLLVGSLTEYEYGTSTDEIYSLENMKVTAIYDDNSTKVLNSDEYNIEFSKNSSPIDEIKSIPDVGHYDIYVSYEGFRQSTSFVIIQSTTPYYTISLSHKAWTYGDNVIPKVTLENYQLQEDDSVDYYYIEKSEYDDLIEQGIKDVNYYANDWTYIKDGTNTLDAGQYYVFAYINFANEPNYTGLTVIGDDTLITVNKKRIVVTPEDADRVSAMTFYYDNSYNTSSDGKYIIGDIALKLITLNNNDVTISDIEGRFEWKNPDQTLNASNNGQSYPIVFIPNYSNNYEIVYSGDELTLPVAIEKGVVGNPEEMKIYFENTNEETTIPYDGQEHSVLLNNHFDIHNHGGELKNIVTFKNEKGEDVAVRYEELEGGSDELYIDGLKEAGKYTFIVSIVDKTNYCWENGTTEPIKFSVKIVNSDLLDVEGDYEPVNPETDGNLDTQPSYMEYMGRWMEEGTETTARDYDAQIQIDYKDQNQTLNITGNLNNKYNDVATYNDFITDTTLTDGKDNYVINGKVDTSGLDNKYTVTKNGEATNFVINENLHSLIMTALRIDLANNSISDETAIYSVAQDDETLKIKVESNFEDGAILGVIVVHFVFDVEGNFVGHKVSVTREDGTMSYSIQMKLVK